MFSCNLKMIVLTFFLLCLANVYGQYDLLKETDQVDLISDINNLAVVQNVETSLGEEENEVLRKLSENTTQSSESSSDSNPRLYGKDTKGTPFFLSYWVLKHSTFLYQHFLWKPGYLF